MTAALPDVAVPVETGQAIELAPSPPGSPARLRAMPVPDTEPAADRQPYPTRSGPDLGSQPTLTLRLVPPPVLHPAASGPAPWPQSSAVGELPDPHAWSRRIAQAVAEVLCGVRPVVQLLRWTSREVYEGLRRRSASATGRPAPGRRAVVRSVRICQPADAVVEAAAVVVARGRVQAVAFRLEGANGRWRMTALEIG